jgi:hypothetical protein
MLEDLVSAEIFLLLILLNNNINFLYININLLYFFVLFIFILFFQQNLNDKHIDFIKWEVLVYIIKN